VFLPNSPTDKSSLPLFVSLHSLRSRLGSFRRTNPANPTTNDPRPTTCELPCHRQTERDPPPNPTPTAPTHHLQPKHGFLQLRANTHHQPLRPSLLISAPSHHCALSQSACPDRLHKRTHAHVRIRLGTAAQERSRRSAARAIEP
jgi:hypothetical protein